MRILHACLSCFYIDDRHYQENELVRQHVEDGHDVLVIASTETHAKDGSVTYCQPSSYLGTDGAQVIRLPYLRFLPDWLARKLRVHPAFRLQLEAFRPDSILFHGACGYELLTVSKYVGERPEILLYVDSHEDRTNSARSFVSRVFLHQIYYGTVLRKSLKNVSKILCVSTETIDFVRDVYQIPEDCLEFFPLGGHPLNTRNYESIRNRKREQLGAGSSQTIFLQAGKQTKRKKLLESLREFSSITASSARLFVAGVLDKSILEEADKLIRSDKRIQFLGWQDSSSLTELLCAADVYLQPGTQSVTMQHSLCCHCAVILDNTKAHLPYVTNNGWLVENSVELRTALISAIESDTEGMGELSFQLATQSLDYRELSKRVLRPNEL